VHDCIVFRKEISIIIIFFIRNLMNSMLGFLSS